MKMTVDLGRTLLVIGTCGVVTFLIRIIPFLLFRGKKVPEAVNYLGRVLPMAIMVLLVLYGEKGISFSGLSSWLPLLCASVLTVLLHLWQKKTFLSIFCGTACYMILIRLIA